MALFQSYEWAFKQLDSAIDHYRDTLVALETSVARPHEHFPTTFGLDDAISNVCERHQSIRLKIEKFFQVNIHLDRIHNRSRKLVSIAILPPETLARIFAIGCGFSCFACPTLSVFGRSIREPPRTLLALTQVCSDWRRIAIDTPSLWSHIDIYRSHRDSECMIPNASLWLDRARNTPLSVHISTYTSQNTMSWSRLRPIFARLSAATSLSIGPTQHAHWPINTLKLWMASVTPSNLRSITILGSERDNLKLWQTRESPDQEAIGAFLAPIRSLRLHNAYFCWDSPVYRGLVDLKISGMRHGVFVLEGEMVTILSACPVLRVLQLVGINILEEHHATYDPVPLHKLEVLDVSGMMPGYLKTMLSIIDPEQCELSVRVNLQDTQEGIQDLQSFFGRSNIVRLFLHGSDKDLVGLAEHLASLQNLRVLLFDLNSNLQPSREEAKLSALADTLGNPTSTPCPHLRTLYLINGELRSETVKTVVESCNIQKLRILSAYRGTDEEIKQWPQWFTQDTKRQSDVDPKALVEDWYEHMW